jgi:hypothetical protein
MKIFRSLKAGGRGGIAGDVLAILVMFLLWRGMLFGLDFVGGAMFDQRANNGNKDYQAFQGEHYFLDGWARWDSGWYKRIVERGYYIEGSQSNVAFFPLYPYAVKGVARIIGNHWAAGLLVSNMSLLLSLFFILGIARMHMDEEGAKRSLRYLLVFPASFFFSAYYSEGLFLLTTSASFYFYLKERYFLCGVAGFLATMTRSTGVALIIAFVLGYLWNKRFKISQMSPAFLWVLLIPCGVAAFMVILKYQVGDPFAFVKYQAGWGRGFTFPLITFFRGIKEIDWTFPHGYHNMDTFMNLVTSIGFLVLPFLLLGKFDISLPIYALLLVIIPLTTGSLLSMMRFEVVAFPSFFALALLGENRSVDRYIVFAFALFLALYNLLFANWYWAG